VPLVKATKIAGVCVSSAPPSCDLGRSRAGLENEKPTICFKKHKTISFHLPVAVQVGAALDQPWEVQVTLASPCRR